MKQIDKKFEALDHRLDELAKAVDDVQWYNKVGDVAQHRQSLHRRTASGKSKRFHSKRGMEPS